MYYRHQENICQLSCLRFAQFGASRSETRVYSFDPATSGITAKRDSDPEVTESSIALKGSIGYGFERRFIKSGAF
jgi:hypothetical protein